MKIIAFVCLSLCLAPLAHGSWLKIGDRVLGYNDATKLKVILKHMGKLDDWERALYTAYTGRWPKGFEFSKGARATFDGQLTDFFKHRYYADHTGWKPVMIPDGDFGLRPMAKFTGEDELKQYLDLRGIKKNDLNYRLSPKGDDTLEYFSGAKFDELPESVHNYLRAKAEVLFGGLFRVATAGGPLEMDTVRDLARSLYVIDQRLGPPSSRVEKIEIKDMRKYIDEVLDGAEYLETLIVDMGRMEEVLGKLDEVEKVVGRLMRESKAPLSRDRGKKIETQIAGVREQVRNLHKAD